MVNCAFFKFKIPTLLQNPKSLAMYGHTVAPFRNSKFKMIGNSIKRFVYEKVY